MTKDWNPEKARTAVVGLGSVVFAAVVFAATAGVVGEAAEAFCAREVVRLISSSTIGERRLMTMGPTMGTDSKTTSRRGTDPNAK